MLTLVSALLVLAMHTFQTRASSSLIFSQTETSGLSTKQSCGNSLLGILVPRRIIALHRTLCKLLRVRIHSVVSTPPPPNAPPGAAAPVGDANSINNNHVQFAVTIPPPPHQVLSQ
jgi:hypothetical protein